MALERGSEEFNMFQEYWAICKKYWVLCDNDIFWESVINETNEFCKKYNNKLFPRRLALTLIEHLESQRVRA